MPSLRRSLSTPAARSSPYPNAPTSSATRTSQGNGFRRSSGSETVGRRVLADIEWWIVAEGQRDIEQEDSDNEQGHTAAAAEDHHDAVVAGAGAHFVAESIESTLLPTDEFAALSISPQTPPARHHRLEGSSSSLESTPEDAVSSWDGMGLGMDYLESPTRRSEDPLPPFLRVRSYSLAEYLEETADQYADFTVSPLASHSPQIFN